MTIKQYGGVFGRNPTFNNVTVDGILTVDQIVEKTGAAGITLDGVTLKDGNVVLANGNGIDFSATSGTGTSELFDDYEEGTWTPTLANSSGVAYTLTTALGYYRKVGSQVTIWFSVASSDNVNDPYYVILGDLPFSSGVDFLDSGCVGSDNASLNRSVVHRGKVRTNATARIYVFYHNGVATTFDFDDALGGMLTYFTA